MKVFFKMLVGYFFNPAFDLFGFWSVCKSETNGYYTSCLHHPLAANPVALSMAHFAAAPGSESSLTVCAPLDCCWQPLAAQLLALCMPFTLA